MSLVTRLIVVQSDAREAQALRYAFERRGAQVELMPADATRQQLAERLRPAGDGDDGQMGPQVIVAGASTAGSALDLLGELRRAVEAAGVEAPIVYLGRGVSREDALTLGATEVLPLPAYLRDVVTLAQIVSGKKRRSRDTFLGELDHFDGVFYMVRAICAMRRSAVLTLVRGLRRGELRFFAGEVTSAQVGMMHGLAALHHLLLWRSANFELHWEEVVRRQQIPMEPDELLADCERFLAEVDEVVSGVELAGVYVQESDKVARVRIPDAIHEVLRLMDGSRTIPDVVEDSRYRTFDTLRIASRLHEEGLIKRVKSPSKGFSFQIGGGLGDWMLGQSGKLGRDRKKVSADEVVTPESELISLDWSDVLPSSEGVDDGLAQVVPAAVAAGEITVGAARSAVEGGAGEDGAGDDGAGDDGARAGGARAGGEEARAGANGHADDRADGHAHGHADGREVASGPVREGLEVITSAAQRDRLFALGTDGKDEHDGAERGEAEPGESTTEPEHEEATEPMSQDSAVTERTPDATADSAASAAEAQDDGGAAAAEAVDEDKAAAAEAVDEDKAAAAEAVDAADDGGAAAADAADNGVVAAREGGGHGFTETEEEFFRQGAKLADKPVPPVDTFADLDPGYEPQTLWQRLFGRKPRGKQRGKHAASATPKPRPKPQASAVPQPRPKPQVSAAPQPRPKPQASAEAKSSAEEKSSTEVKSQEAARSGAGKAPGKKQKKRKKR